MDLFFPMLFFLPAVLMFGVEIKINKNSLKINILVQMIIVVMVFIYGYLRNHGIIIYASDEPEGFLWSTWYYNGIIIMITTGSAFIGIVFFCLYAFFQSRNENHSKQ